MKCTLHTAITPYPTKPQKKKKRRNPKGDPEALKSNSPHRIIEEMGGRRSSMCLPSLMVAVVFMISAINMAEAQSGGDVPSCAQELIPCANYLNSTNPPSSCCDPIKKTVANELTCLCNLFHSPVLQSFNITTEQALRLSRSCGVTSDLSSCNRATAPPPASLAPPATRGGDQGGAGRVSFTGFSFLLLLWASMLFN